MQSIHQSLLNKLRSWLVQHRIISAVTVISFIILAVTVGFIVSQQRPHILPATKVATVKKSNTPPPKVFYSPLTGNVVANEADTIAAVTGVMIENSLDARPQSGLKSAGVVFEAIAEGGITRFLALYQEAKPQLLGPVRSLRMYDIDWFAPFQSSIAHVGGSMAALQEVRNGTYRDIDQFFNGGSYWRANDRYSPHNVYTSFEKLDALNAKKGFTSSRFTAWPRQDGKPVKTIDASNVSVHISGQLYDSQYAYDPKANNYTRSQAAETHIDREGGPIQPSVIIVMDTIMTKVFEDGYREQITTTGSGRVRIFQNGTVTEGTWQKKDTSSQLVFADGNGKEIVLNRGQTWIIAVPANEGGNVTWQ